jgi:PAS domain-containing protein
MENWVIPHVRSTWSAFRIREWLSILIWPVLGLLVVAFLWSNLSSRMADIEDEGEALIRNRAAATANSYAQQIRHTVEQLDQILLRLKYQWEEQQIPVNLERERLQGLFPHNPALEASIYDANGNLVTTTYPGTPISVNASHLPFFQKQAAECCRGLDVSEVRLSNLHGKPVVRFSRRLTQFDGTFGGVAVASVNPSYLVTFQESYAAGEHDFVTLRLQAGPVLASRVGEKTENVPIFYRRNPIFPSPQGVMMEPAEKFRDNRTRFVAWHKLQNYPLVALAGISMNEAMASFTAQARALQQTTIAQTLLILLSAFGAAYLSAKLAYRRRHAEETQATYRLATDAANEGFYMLRPLHGRHGELTDFRLEDCNNRAADLICMTRKEMIGKNGSEWERDSFAQEVLSLCRAIYQRGLIEEEVRVPPDSPLRAQWIYRRMVKSSAGLVVSQVKTTG